MAIIGKKEFFKGINDIKFDKNFLLDVDLLIENIKICDPAVGSGAFIIGSLNFIINIKKNYILFFNLKILLQIYMKSKEI